MAAYGLTIAPNNAAIVYSPGNWAQVGGTAISINAGSYLRVLFSGNSCGLTFDVSNLGSPASEIWTQIDGFPAVQQSVAANVTVAVPSALSAAPYHLLRVWVKSTSETLNRWSVTGSPSQTAVILTGIQVDSGATVFPPLLAPFDALFYGDSITEDIRTVNETAANDMDRNDTMSCWSLQQGSLLGCEVGVIGFGATGLTHGGSGGVPAFPATWQQIIPGTQRTFGSRLKFVAINHGTNDQSASGSAVTAAMLGVIAGMLPLLPSAAKLLIMRPFGGYQSAALQAAVAAAASPRVRYIDTTGVLNTAIGIDSLGLHPQGANDLGIIGPAVASRISPLLTASASSPRFRNMF